MGRSRCGESLQWPATAAAGSSSLWCGARLRADECEIEFTGRTARVNARFPSECPELQYGMNRVMLLVAHADHLHTPARPGEVRCSRSPPWHSQRPSLHRSKVPSDQRRQASVHARTMTPYPTPRCSGKPEAVHYPGSLIPRTAVQAHGPDGPQMLSRRLKLRSPPCGDGSAPNQARSSHRPTAQESLALEPAPKRSSGPP